MDGAANEELVRYLSASLGIARRAISLRAGASNRRKMLEIDGLTIAEVEQRLGLTAR